MTAEPKIDRETRGVRVGLALLVLAFLLGGCGTTLAQPGTEPPEVAGDAVERPLPFPPMALPEGFFSPFDNERDAWTWINFKERSIITFGQVCSFAQPVELAVCQRGGKSHESLIETFAIAQNIHAGAILVGFDQARTPPGPGGSPPTVAHYDTATISVEWPAAGATLGPDPYAGERERHRVEDLLLLAGTGKPMPPVNWLFIGSYFAKVPKTWRNKDDTVDVYAADYFDSGLVTTYNTPGAVFDNPMPEGANDESYYGNLDALPAPGTVVMIRIDFGEPVERPILVAPEEGHRPDGAGAGGDAPPPAAGEQPEDGEAPDDGGEPGDPDRDPPGGGDGDGKEE